MKFTNFDRLNRLVSLGNIAIVSMLLFTVPVDSSLAGGSGPIAISPVLQPDPTRGSQLNDVAVNTSGLTIAAWDQFTYSGNGSASIGAAIQTGGRWGTPFTISGTTGFSMTPKVAVGADGTMAVSWTYQDPATQASPQQKIQVAVKPAGSSTWTTNTLDTGNIGGVSITPPVPLGIDANGNVTAAWTLWDGARHIIKAATCPKGSSVFGAKMILSGPNDDGLYLSLSVNDRGDAAVAYTISPYAGNTTGTNALYVFRSGFSGSWTAPVIISETLPSSTGYVTNPLVVLDANGMATVAYFAYGVETVRQLTTNSWTAPASVITPPTTVSSFGSIDLGMDQAGNAVIAASIFDATINVDRSSVWVSVGTPGGTWTSQQRLTDPTVPVDAYATQVAVSRDGGLASVGWIDHYHGTVQVSKFSNGIWSPATTLGRGTAFSSFQEVLGLDAASGTVARAIWKNSKSGTQIYSSNYK